MRTELFTQVGLDSGALGALGSVVHRFTKEGTYVATVLVDGRDETEFEIEVAEGGRPAAQVDLASAGVDGDRGKCCDSDRPEVTIDVGGYVSFYVGSGARRYAVVVRNTKKRGVEFDSRRLDDGDMFATTVLRPGKYRIENEHGGGSSGLEVRYVRLGRARYQPAKPIRLKVGEKLSKGLVKAGPGQGLIFEATGPARIVVELVEPDDGEDGYDRKGD